MGQADEFLPGQQGRDLTYYYPTEEELQQWIDYADSMKDTWIDVLGEDLYNRAYEIFGVWEG